MSLRRYKGTWKDGGMKQGTLNCNWDKREKVDGLPIAWTSARRRNARCEVSVLRIVSVAFSCRESALWILFWCFGVFDNCFRTVNIGVSVV